MNAPGRASHLTTGATTVLSATSTTLHRVVVGSDLAAGLLKLHDCAASGDVAAGNMITTIKLDSRGMFEFEAICDKGLVAVVSGTCDVTVVHG